MEISKRRIGVNFKNNKADIVIWAPEAQTVSIKTPGVKISLSPTTGGYWVASSKQLYPNDQYWILVDGKQFPDPASVCQPEGVHGASMALNLDYHWNDQNWNNHLLQDYIIYEIHTGTFSDAGTFSGIVSHLDHLVDLGINAIELMPIVAFPGERNWGYDGVFPFAVQHSYGGADGLRQLVQECHSRGISVILDVVYNHLGPEGNYLSEFGPYFTDKYHTPWGEAINFDGRNCDGVRNFYIENALMWFRDFHIDALRLDAVHAIKDYGAVHLLQDLRQAVDALMKETNRRYYLIAECDLNDPRYISTLDKNGLGMDAQWVDEFHHALRVTAGEARKGYYSDFSGIADLAKSYRNAYVYDGIFSQERAKVFGKSAHGHQGNQMIVFSQNHDQVGNRMLGERTSKLFSAEMLKVMAAAVMVSPFIPMLFMGEEWGETNPFLYFVSHSDAELISQVREGRRAEFSTMHKDGIAPDPQSIETFKTSKLNWQKLSADSHTELLSWYRQLIALRKTYPSLRTSEVGRVRTSILTEKNILLLERYNNDTELVLCIFNFSQQKQEFIVPKYMERLSKVADSSPAQNNLPGTIGPLSFIAYAAYYV